MNTTTQTGGLRMPMAASTAAAGLARSLIEQRLIRWGVPAATRENVHLVLAELVANAVAATPAGGSITVHCEYDDRGVCIGVTDPSPEIPRNPPPVVELSIEDLDLREDRFDDNGGWGLTIVKALSADCGVTPLPSGGKTVWSRLRS